jgi:hypothetical protein
MQKKNITKKRSPRTTTVHMPKGRLPSDKFEAVSIGDDSLSDIGVQIGDVAVAVITSDIESGDLVFYVTKKASYVGRYYPAPDGRVRLEPLSDEYETDTFGAGEGKAVARVLHFERDGQIVEIKMALRPIRQSNDAPTISKRQKKQTSTEVRHNQAEIEKLQRQLDKLTDEGEAHNESGMFRLERRIYDLKRESGRDEWPEVIGDE